MSDLKLLLSLLGYLFHVSGSIVLMVGFIFLLIHIEAPTPVWALYVGGAGAVLAGAFLKAVAEQS